MNPLKSAVDRPAKRKFLGFTVSRNGALLKVADKAIDKLKARIRELTRRTRGRRLTDIVAELRETLLGWKATFGIAEVLKSSARYRQMGTTQILKTPALALALPVRYFSSMGLPDLAAR